jgi:hypothetical protein
MARFELIGFNQFITVLCSTYLKISVIEFFDDQFSCEIRLTLTSLLQPLQQVRGCALHDHPDAADPTIKTEEKKVINTQNLIWN